MITSRTVAREWMIFLPSVIFGFLIALVAFDALVDKWYHYAPPSALSELLSQLFGRFRLSTWLFVLAPYLIIQLSRSIIWSIKTLKTKS